jgi:hypothetical protein
MSIKSKRRKLDRKRFYLHDNTYLNQNNNKKIGSISLLNN